MVKKARKKYQTKSTRARAHAENRALGSMGGTARAKALTPERRREIALKASKAAAAKRTKRAGTVLVTPNQR